jgi:hypothetical protein
MAQEFIPQSYRADVSVLPPEDHAAAVRVRMTRRREHAAGEPVSSLTEAEARERLRRAGMAY